MISRLTYLVFGTFFLFFAGMLILVAIHQLAGAALVGVVVVFLAFVLSSLLTRDAVMEERAMLNELMAEGYFLAKNSHVSADYTGREGVITIVVEDCQRVFLDSEAKKTLGFHGTVVLKIDQLAVVIKQNNEAILYRK